VQGEKMIDPILPQFVSSTLDVKISANYDVSSEELNLPEGKSIAQLIYEEKEQEKNNQKNPEE
jgi:hypothetical protein